jgi:hypothetical protein
MLPGFSSGKISGRDMLDRLVFVLAEAARLPDVAGYLGNPDLDGPTTTTYHYRLVAAADAPADPPTSPPASDTSSVWGLVLFIALGLLVLAGLTVWWALS